MKHFTNILYVLEQDAEQPCGLERAVALARGNQARLKVVSVIESLPAGAPLEGLDLTTDDLQAASLAESEQRLNALVEPLREAVAIETKVLTGKLFLEVIREVVRHDHDLVMKCVGDKPPMAALFGSEDLHLLRKCPCPLWLGRPQDALNYRRVLAAVDVEPLVAAKEQAQQQALNATILDLAAALATSEFAELHVAHAWTALGEPILRGGMLTTPAETKIDAYIEAERRRHGQALQQALADLEARAGTEVMQWLKPVRHLPKGAAREELPALATRIDADILVLGTLGRSGVSGLLIGNTAEAVLQRIDCAVLAVKPEGFVCPVVA
ncbi:MAG: universal stress protein [Lamprobacter sp.]|uniref:universal stress protein n=1 Tax=Lamprobacter sp. TaxID=3100796 RepID=UPI002B261D53|nr:universal stress protein [Lamprobacter sp.]MEA3642132.1 universal stress protein [Lamprobacter sp.]